MLSWQNPAMRIQDHLATLEQEGQRFAATIGVADLDAPVPTCPGWTVRG